jgi:hypothetical protein
LNCNNDGNGKVWQPLFLRMRSGLPGDGVMAETPDPGLDYESPGQAVIGVSRSNATAKRLLSTRFWALSLPVRRGVSGGGSFVLGLCFLDDLPVGFG